MKIFKYLLIITTIFTLLNASIIEKDKIVKQKDFENQAMFIDLDNYKILEFNKRIKNIQFTNSKKISAEFVNDKETPEP